MAATAENLQPEIPNEIAVVSRAVSFISFYIAAAVLVLLSVVESLILCFELNPELYSLIVSGVGFISVCVWLASSSKLKKFDVTECIVLFSVILLICGRALGQGNVANASMASNYFSLLLNSPALVAAVWLAWNTFNRAYFVAEEKAADKVSKVGVALTKGIKLTTKIKIEEGSVAALQNVGSGALEFRILGKDDEIYSGSEIVDGSAKGTTIPVEEFVSSLGIQNIPGLQNTQSFQADLKKALPLVLLALVLTVFPIFFFALKVNALSLVSASVILTLLLLIPEQFTNPFASKFSLFSKLGLQIPDINKLGVLATIKEILVTTHGKTLVNRIRVTKAEILDDRLDKQQVITLVANLAGNLDTNLWQALAHFCYECLGTNFKLMPLSEVRLINDTGITATIQGVEFSLGDELFIINRGVQIDPSEIGPVNKNTIWIYISLAGTLIARFAMNNSIDDELDDLRPRLQSIGIKARALQPGEVYRSELRTPSLIVRGSKESNEGAALSASVADEQKADIILSKISFPKILDAILLARKTVWNAAAIKVVFFALFILSITLVLLLNPAPVIVEVFLLFSLIVLSYSAPPVNPPASYL